MARASVDQYNAKGLLINGFDYINQAWVKDGRYVDCGHPQVCNCYGHLHMGEEPPRGDRSGMPLAQNGHHADCDAAEEPYHNFQCSELCPLQYKRERYEN